jgi:hypothetical protein
MLPDGKMVKVSNLPFPVRKVMRHDLTGIKRLAGFHLYDFYGMPASIPIAGNKSKKYFCRGEIAITTGDYFSMFRDYCACGQYLTPKSF